MRGVPNRIRTGVAAVKGRCPRPLDDGDVLRGPMDLAARAPEINDPAAPSRLMRRGCDRSTLSLMATGDTIERELGHRYRRVEEMADDPNAPHVAYIGVDSPVTGQGAAAATLAYIGACAAAAGVVASGGALALTI